MGKKHTLSYLPLFERDLTAARDYIAFRLHNPAAALRLVEDTYTAILKRLDNPISFPPYRSLKDRKQPYYTIHIRNYVVFYVVTENVMEVRRFVYSRRNLPNII